MPDKHTLSPEQQGAREFWRQASAGDLTSNYFFNEFLEHHSNYQPGEFDSLKAGIDKLLGDLGYGTDIDTVSSELSAGAAVDYGYWSGSYALFDEEGSRYWLMVGRNGATLQLPPATVDPTQTEVDSVDKYKSLTALTNAAFANRRLTLSNDRFAFKLEFERVITDESMAQKDFDGKTLHRQGQPRCNGSVVITQNGASRVLSVYGKRGSYTREGVMQADDGDPIATWVGSYSLINITDDSAWRQSDDPLVIEADEQDISLQWGSMMGTNIRFNNNTLLSDFQGQADTSIGLQFETLADGSKRLHGAMACKGKNQNLVGFWTHHTEKPQRTAPAHMIHPLALFAVGAASTSGNDLDMQTLPDGAVVNLPTGVPNNDYKLLLTLKSASVLGNPPYTWTIDPVLPNVHLDVDSTDSTKANLVAGLTPANIGSLDVKVNFKGSNVIGKTLTLRLEVLSLTPLIVTPTTLPPVVRTKNYTMTLVANGGRGPYIWKDAGSSCPQGLAFDPGTQTLSGCVTDAAVSQNVFVLKVMVSSDQSAIMNSLTVTLPISVVEPAQVAKEATDYTAVALACAGTIFLAITAAKNIYEWIKAKEKNAGDPAYKNNYVMAKELATSLKSGIEGVVGKNFVHYIETALQFDIKYPNRLLDLQGLKLSALELYESHIDIYNRRIATVIKKIADEKAGKNDAKKLNKLDADLDKLKVDFMNDLNSTHILIGDELIARKREEEAEATKSFKEKLRGCI